ncbi:MAG: DNA repair protein RecN [Microscillaceae bacterium]|nr:DNA repair protein RecN [Microscillaceae bacterium]
MLTDLLIKNYALIEQLKMKPHESLNIITGETGAGKSIMLGAIGLLLGNRADLRVLFNTEEKCVVEGSFLIWSYNLQDLFAQLELDYEDHTTIRREISPGGKSRAFINDTPVTLEVLKKVGNYLIDVHSQHDNLLLGDNLYQLHVVDIFAANKALLEDYQKTYREFSKIKSQYQKLQDEFGSFQKEFEYNNFLLQELLRANFQPDEQDELEAELKLLESSEEVKIKLNQVVDFLSRADNAANDELRVMVNALGSISDLSPKFEELRQRLESAMIELQDIAAELEREEEMVEFNPERIETVSGRLSLLYNLQQKHQATDVADLLKIQEALDHKVSKVVNFDEEISRVKAALDQKQQQLTQKATLLSESRASVIPQIEQELKGLLAELGMPNGTIKITQEQIEPTAEGLDLINFLFSANKGVEPQEISRVASGGEFSRLMLSIKYILAGKTSLPTIVFDEIDTGISGEIAVKMGTMFKTMAQKHQIIAISHLHQIAAKGNHHYFVFKDDSKERTISRIRQLSDEERVYEIAQMISGSKPSESAILSAKEMLEMN